MSRLYQTKLKGNASRWLVTGIWGTRLFRADGVSIYVADQAVGADGVEIIR